MLLTLVRSFLLQLCASPCHWERCVPDQRKYSAGCGVCMHITRWGLYVEGVSGLTRSIMLLCMCVCTFPELTKSLGLTNTSNILTAYMWLLTHWLASWGYLCLTLLHVAMPALPMYCLQVQHAFWYCRSDIHAHFIKVIYTHVSLGCLFMQYCRLV